MQFFALKEVLNAILDKDVFFDIIGVVQYIF